MQRMFVEEILKWGKRRRCQGLEIRWLDKQPWGVGIIVPAKEVPSAVARNRVRRRVKEALSRVAMQNKLGRVIIVRRPLTSLRFQELVQTLTVCINN